ncbi:MAG TPA: hypothetical protein VHF47_11020 [Acidimicrobiales bacterium]|nr:hypothetical protein [Acidimicrobiales bacterium]
MGVGRRTEEGSALILALAFLSLFGLLMAAILGQVDAHVRTTLVVRTHEAKVYGADAAVDYAIQALQADDTVCPDEDSGRQELPAPPLEGDVDLDIEVACETTEGNVLGVRGYAVVTTEAKGGPGSLDTSNGSIARTIEGPVWVDGDIDLAKPVTVQGAHLFQRSPCQSTPIDKLTVTPSPPFTVRCTTAATPDEDHELPGHPSGSPQPSTGDGGASCRTFSPGRYTTAPELKASNFFKSGFYYFEDIGDWTITQVLFGGTPQDDEAKLLVETPCASEAATTAARGVMFVLGGTSRIIVGNGARIELFTPNAAAVDPGDPGTSIRSVLAEDAATNPWKVSTAGSAILDVAGGNTRDMAVHGLVYTPNNVVNLFVTGGTVDAQLQGGAKVLRIGLATSNSGTGLKVSTTRGPGRRTVTIVAKAVSPDGGRAVEARAVVKIENDADRSVTVVSRSLQ